MKKIYFLFLLTYFTGFAQQKNPRQDFMNFASGKVIVKLKDNVDAKITYGKTGKGTTQTDIGQLLGVAKRIKSSTVLFDQQFTNASVLRKASNFSDSRLKSVSSVKNTFVLELTKEQDNVLELVETLKKSPLVEYAEPDYIFSIGDFKEESKVYTGKELASFLSTSANDPLFTQQNNIVQTKLNEVWDTTTGDGSQIIAILDTGIDYTHPDLAANIWINQQELNGTPGFDDDENGFIDDVNGWDFFNNDNKPLDDNKHGTHVAGIAGAVGNNNIGIAGGAWNVKLMPIKAFQASGAGNSSDISAGIAYAVNNGATVINMSFSSAAESLTMRAALENAYLSTVLVAAAGNNRVKIGPCPYCHPFYPASYNFVLGVVAEGDYSNTDQDGPNFSNYFDLKNYEVKAPGNNIISTIPNGGYQKLTGTSMSAPLVSAGVALYKQIKPNDSKGMLFGNLANSSQDFVDFNAALNSTPHPILKVYNVVAKDNLPGNVYPDGKIDAGETINLFSSVRNFWGQSGNIKLDLNFGGNEFQEEYYRSKVTLIDSTSVIPPLSHYAYNINTTNPFKIKIAADTPHNTEIELKITVSDTDLSQIKDTITYNFTVQNKIKLKGIIKNDIILYANKEYFIDELLILDNSKMTIQPGVKITFEGSYPNILLINNSSIIAKGTKDNFIQFIANSYSTIKLTTSICDFCDFNTDMESFGGKFEVTFDTISNSKFTENTQLNGGYIEKSNIYDFRTYQGTFKFNNFFGSVKYDSSDLYSNLYWGRIDYGPATSGTVHTTGYIIAPANGNKNTPIENLYLGTENKQIIDDWLIWDLFDYGYQFPISSSSDYLSYDNVPVIPFSEPHAIIWKVLINGKLPFASPAPYESKGILKYIDYDENYQLEPIGVGTHELKIYFNRDMNTSVNPQITYGVVYPYNQKSIVEDGTWSTDGKTYTVNHEIKIGAADGISRIRIRGAKDLDNFEIPDEFHKYNILIQSAGSASTGFEATPGLGKIVLDWEVPEVILLEDVLGYNMYRYELKDDNTETDPIKLNTALIGDINYIDFNVEEGKSYYYKYKILRTNFEETDYSKIVMSSPLTSKLGDSNGDFAVNVMDLVQTVDYILGNNPTPFIFKAADVNNDTAINVLDIVGTVDIILNGRPGKALNSRTIDYISNEPIGDATFYWKKNDLYVESQHPITGLQLAFSPDFHFTPNPNLPAFEWLNYNQDSDKVLMMYSFTNSVTPAGKTKILTATATPNDNFDISKAVVASSNGRKLNPLYRSKVLDVVDAPVQKDQPEFLQVYPNPSSGVFTLDYYLPATMESVEVGIYDLTGKKVWSSNAFKNTSGYSKKEIDVSFLPKNIYFLVVDVIGDYELKKRNVKKIIIN